jgi:HEAT repeat protein
MSAKRLYLWVPKRNRGRFWVLVVILLLIGCQQAEISPERPAFPVDETIAEAELSRQLKINREALLKGTSEQIRIDAATVMLFSEDALARKILLEVLRQSENVTARVAVCKALSQARTEQKLIEDKENFIPPLFDILTTEVDESAKSAAEAILIFEYDQISKPLEGMVTDPSLSVKARLNAIYALRLQPDVRAIFKLIDRLDDSDEEVAAGAEKALRFLGTPVGKDAEAREQIRSELERKGRDEFFRDLLIRQEAKMRELKKESDSWQERYLQSLEEIYNGISDDKAKGQFLVQPLGDSKEIIRLWALEKVSQWRKSTRPKLPAELGPILVDLISDEDRDVRLKTAKLLSLMGELNSAERLLEQLKIEEDDEVKIELFAALGGACHYAFLPDSRIKIAKEIKKQTLEWAVKYLFEQEAKKSQKGAEVIKKLLEQDGLTAGEVDRYLGMLSERYKEERERGEEALRGELLSAMAGLCAQSVYKAESAKRFSALFEEALRDEADLVREAAVGGVIYIDKASALRILREFVRDRSVIVRKKIIELAGEVGGQADLVWLWGKIGSNAESEPAWQSMLKIFKRSEAAILSEWIGKFDSPNTKGKLSEEQKVSVLEIAEAKAEGENKIEMRDAVRKKLANFYRKAGEFERAAEYLGMLREVAQTEEEKEWILAKLVDVYLNWPNVTAAARLVDNCLLQKDLDPNSVIVRSIDDYLTAPPAGTDPNAVLEALTKIKSPEDRPKWRERLKEWTDRFGQAEAADKQEGGGD